MDIKEVSPVKPPKAGYRRFLVQDDELCVMDSNGNVNRFAYTGDNETFDGEPTNYVAATAMAETYEPEAGKTIELTALVAGVLSPAPSLVLVDPASPDETASLSENVGTGVVTVNLATDSGDAAVGLLPTGTGDIVITLDTAGPAGNDKTVSVVLPTVTDAFGNATPEPSAALSAALVGDDHTVSLANTAGTAGVLTLTESSGSLGEITITQTAGFAGVWGNDDVTATVNIAAPLGPLAVVATTTGATLLIAITLEADADGLPVAVSDDHLADEVTAALLVVDGTDDFSAFFTVASSTAGDFDTAAPSTAMAGGVDPIPDDAANTATLIAAEIAGLAGVDSAVADVGGDIVSAAVAPISFTGGGDNALITTDLDALAALLLADSAIINGVVGAGDGATLCTDSTTTLTGGADQIDGTPGKLGRIATDGTDVWTAMVENQTTTQAGWVKTFTATP